MILQVYTLFDIKALTYSPPFFTHKVELAKRMVSEVATDRTTSVGLHPGDFKLFGVGFFDDEKGVLTPFMHPEHVCDVVALLPGPATPDLFASSPEAVQALNEALSRQALDEAAHADGAV